MSILKAYSAGMNRSTRNSAFGKRKGVREKKRVGKRKDVPLKVKSVYGDDGTVNCVLAMVRFSNGCLYGASSLLGSKWKFSAKCNAAS